MKCKIITKDLLKDFVWVSALAMGIILYYQRLYQQWMISDGLFLSGLLFVCIGLFRVTRKLGLFDSTIYGSKRLFGKTKQDFVEYVQDHPYTQNFAEILLLGVGFILLSFLF